MSTRCLALLVAVGLSVSASSVIEVSLSNFDSLVSPGGRENCFAPWCPHCQDLAPIWEEVGAQLSSGSEVKVAKVDCDANRALCKRFGVQQFPTIYLINEATSKVYEFEGSRTLEAMTRFINETQWKDQSPSDFPKPNTEMISPPSSNPIFRGLAAVKQHLRANPFWSFIYFIVIAAGVAWTYSTYVEASHLS